MWAIKPVFLIHCNRSCYKLTFDFHKLFEENGKGGRGREGRKHGEGGVGKGGSGKGKEGEI